MQFAVASRAPPTRPALGAQRRRSPQLHVDGPDPGLVPVARRLQVVLHDSRHSGLTSAGVRATPHHHPQLQACTRPAGGGAGRGCCCCGGLGKQAVQQGEAAVQRSGGLLSVESVQVQLKQAAGGGMCV